MIVETIVTNGCTCHISDEAYKDKSQDEIQRIIRDFSDLIARCMKEKMAKGESIIKEKAFRKLGEAPEGTQCIDFPKPHNHGVKVKCIYKNYRTNFRESQCIILPSFR